MTLSNPLLPLTAIALAASSAMSAPFVASRVSGSAQWIVHADVERLVKSDIGRHILSQVDGWEGGNRIEAIQTLIGGDLQTIMSSATFYGTNAVVEQGVTVVDGVFNPDRVTSAARSFDTYLQFEYAGHAILSWMPGTKTALRSGSNPDVPSAKRLFAAFAAPRVMAIAQSLPSIKSALDTIDGRAPSLGANSPLGNIVPSGPSSFLTAAADLPRGAAGHALLRQTRRITVSLGETEGTVEGDVRLTAANVQAASQIFVILQAMIASAILQQNDRPELAQFARSLQPRLAGTRVQVTFRHPAQQCLAILKNWRDYLQMLPQAPARR